MIDEKVKIKCTKCSQLFRERAQKVRNGFQVNCQHCGRLITFDSTSEDRNIRKALANAREVRLAIEEAREAARLAQQAQLEKPAPVMDRSQY
jgi:DNA-directed RNA polymerase subunit M/transcription elongation factor TFIIS